MSAIDRRRFMKSAAATAAVGVSGMNAHAASRNGRIPEPGRPNVLVIMTDQHRADLMSCSGNDLVPTPNIDMIASRGVRFDNAYCPYPVCVASRMSLLTGLYSHTTGAIDNTDPLDWRYRTMAHHFAANGYLTGLIGKMHFNDAHKHGFEYYLSINDWLMYLGPKVQLYADEIASHPHNSVFARTIDDSGAGFPDIEGLWDNGSSWIGHVTRSDFKSVASKIPAEEHLDAFIARESVKFMRRYRDQEQPFFLVASFMKPHTPFFPPAEWAEKYPIESMPLREVNDYSSYPEHLRNRISNMQRQDPWQLKAGRAGYLGNLSFADHCVGQLYSGLEELGLLDNTIVVYTSDHGEMDGTHGLYQKFCMFDPSTKAPLIVSHPGRFPEGAVSNALTEYMGLYPTLAELAGIPQPSNATIASFEGAPSRIEANSFADIVRNPTLPGPETAFSEYNLRTRISTYMVRTAGHKYVFNHGTANELYDLEADPGENENRIEDPLYRRIRDDLHDRLVAWYDPETNPYRPRS